MEREEGALANGSESRRPDGLVVGPVGEKQESDRGSTWNARRARQLAERTTPGAVGIGARQNRQEVRRREQPAEAEARGGGLAQQDRHAPIVGEGAVRVAGPFDAELLVRGARPGELDLAGAQPERARADGIERPGADVLDEELVASAQAPDGAAVAAAGSGAAGAP